MLTFPVYFVSGYYVNIPFLHVFCMMSLGLVNDSAWINYDCAVGFTFKDNTITNQKQTNFLGLIYWQQCNLVHPKRCFLGSLRSFGSV